MSNDLKITGLDRLTKGAGATYSGELTVELPGMGGGPGRRSKVRIINAPTLEAAKLRAVQEVDAYAKNLLALAKAERDRLM